MQDLKKHEQFELEVLDRLNSGRFLNQLVFGGGTMLRLCYGLNRYSVDLDFWVVKDIDFAKIFKDMKDYLGKYYTINDAANKYFTILFELKSPAYPRALKIEIRKETKKIKTESSIAYSKYADNQVLLKTVALANMMSSKIEAFLDRKEIRDAYDMEFLLRHGIKVEAPVTKLRAIVKGIEALQVNDYKVKLGSLLEPEERKYYQDRNFSVLLMEIKENHGVDNKRGQL